MEHIINQYIRIVEDDDYNPMLHVYYMDNKLNWSYNTTCPLEFYSIVLYSPFLNDIKDIEINEANKQTANVDMYFYWITGGNRYYYEASVDFDKQVLPEIKKLGFEKLVLDALNNSKTFGELHENLKDINYELSEEVYRIISELEENDDEQ